MVILLEMLKPPKSGKRFVTTLLKQHKKDKVLIMNALCDILWLIVIDANCYLLAHAAFI